MNEPSQTKIPQLIVPTGTRIVVRSEEASTNPEARPTGGHVGLIIQSPEDALHSYLVRFPDGAEFTLHRSQFSILKEVKSGPLTEPTTSLHDSGLEPYIIYRCVVGSQAYGLSREGSDFDRRGIYLPPADLEWSLYGVPQQLEDESTQECYWELKKFITLALKANPNILECLFSPLVEHSSDVAEELLSKRSIFLSKRVYQTYSGYVMSQFKRLEQDLRTSGEIKWKHAMHLIRLLIQGIGILKKHSLAVSVSEHRESLLEIRDQRRSWSEVNQWRIALHREFDEAFRSTKLPEAPDYAQADRILISARRKMAEVKHDS